MTTTTAGAARFWAKVNKAGPLHPLLQTRCWPWTGSRHRKGYGNAWLDGRGWQAHRAAWALEVGAIPAGTRVLHRCDRRACVRPQHLFIGTDLDNARDRDAKGRSGAKKRCGDGNGMRKHPDRHPARVDPAAFAVANAARAARRERDDRGHFR